MFEVLINNLINNNADISDIGFTREQNGILEEKHFTNAVEVLNTDSALEELLKDRKIQSYVWNKLFRKEIWDNIWFDPKKMFEDIDIMYKLFINAKKIVLIDSFKYIYVQRDSSIMHTHNSSFISDRLDVIINRYNYISNLNKEKLNFINKYAFAVNMIVIYRKIILENYNDIYNKFLDYYDLFINIIKTHENDIRPILTTNQNTVLDFMLDDLSTAPNKIRSIKDIDK